MIYRDAFRTELNSELKCLPFESGSFLAASLNSDARISSFSFYPSITKSGSLSSDDDAVSVNNKKLAPL